MVTPHGITRRAVLAAAAMGAVSACAGPARTSSPAGSGQLIEHRFGTTRVPSRPARVVALGSGDAEAALALGVVPLAGTDVLGLDDLSRPWVAPALAGREAPTVLDWRALPYEQIVRLEPDVILYVNSPGDRQAYETLSRIAPTVAAPAGSSGSFGVEWREQLMATALALGRGAAARAVVAEVSGSVAAAGAAHPELDGLTVIGGLALGDQLYFWPARDPRTRLLGELGMRSSPALEELDDTGYLLSVSPERYDLLRCDLLYLSVVDQGGAVAVDRDGLLQQVPAARRGRLVLAPGPAWYGSPTADGDYAGALALGGALGIPACLDRLVADLSAAVRR